MSYDTENGDVIYLRYYTGHVGFWALVNLSISMAAYYLVSGFYL